MHELRKAMAIVESSLRKKFSQIGSFQKIGGADHVGRLQNSYRIKSKTLKSGNEAKHFLLDAGYDQETIDSILLG